MVVLSELHRVALSVTPHSAALHVGLKSFALSRHLRSITVFRVKKICSICFTAKLFGFLPDVTDFRQMLRISANDYGFPPDVTDFC
ncbi:hypothetical protein Barb7_00344 [Bacteroidales bacterium Barb7]|nr:hypothetical protein Barb7_00344 [Bacteroidales bacterium Barb7]